MPGGDYREMFDPQTTCVQIHLLPIHPSIAISMSHIRWVVGGCADCHPRRRLHTGEQTDIVMMTKCDATKWVTAKYLQRICHYYIITFAHTTIQVKQKYLQATYSIHLPSYLSSYLSVQLGR